MARKRLIIRIRREGCKMLQHLALNLLLLVALSVPLELVSLSEQHGICPVFLSRRAIKAVTQNVPAAKKEITASTWMGNIKAHRVAGKTLKATNCVKKKRLLRARVWIHFERSSFEHGLFGYSLFECCFLERCSFDCDSSEFCSSKSTSSNVDSFVWQQHEQQQNVQQSGKERR